MKTNRRQLKTNRRQCGRPPVAILATIITALAILGGTTAKGDESTEAGLRNLAPIVEQIRENLDTASKAIESGDVEKIKRALTRASRLLSLARGYAEETGDLRRDPPKRTARWPLHRFDLPVDSLFDEIDPIGSLHGIWRRLDRLMESSDNMFDSIRGNWGESRSPRMDMREDDKSYTITLDMPGLDKSEINVKAEGRLLTITGRSGSETEEQDSSGKTLRRERRSGSFQRSITLPGPVKSDEIEANYLNGVLKIILPKAAALPASGSIPIN